MRIHLRLFLTWVLFGLALGQSTQNLSVKVLSSQSTQSRSQGPLQQQAESFRYYQAVQLGILDKVTGRVLKKTVEMNKPIQFGTITIDVKKCWHSSSATHPETKAYLVIYNRSPGQAADIVFKGWMFASTPSISTLEHPVYDVWIMGVDLGHATSNQSALADPATKLKNSQKLDEILKSVKR